MNKNYLAVATMTWVRDAQEEQLMREAMQHLAELDVPVYITDGGSGEEFLAYLSGFSHFTVQRADEPGVWPQVRQSLSAMADSVPFVLYTEPDKAEFFCTSLQDFIDKAPDSDQVGVVLASRSQDAFATFPAFQQHTETTINRCCAEITTKLFDYTYGPFLFNRKLVPYLAPLEKEIGWGWRPYVFCLAHRLGYDVESQALEVPCPVDQRQDDPKERIYRMRQLNQNIQGIVLAATVPVE
ncbi:hypothetical protein [Telluribacter sp. SYSU D00476]|uniref:hypothetical protein n=1 Tax=Telluribacter sp. SYSU D00476 TaxID=2811430 RepID=UPI001FF1FBA9|nr:hypothetical protein [Telluribacter sp. SYSU D00476]